MAYHKLVAVEIVTFEEVVNGLVDLNNDVTYSFVELHILLILVMSYQSAQHLVVTLPYVLEHVKVLAFLDDYIFLNGSVDGGNVLNAGFTPALNIVIVKSLHH